MTDLLPRRELLKSVAVVGGAAWLTSGAANAAEKAKPGGCSPVSLDKAQAVCPALIGAKNFSVNVSPDKLATGLIFDSLQADYGPERAAKGFTPLKAAFLEIPLVAGSDPDCQLLGYTFDLRGHVDVTAGARASVVLAVGGESCHVEFPFDNALNENFFRRLFFLSHTAGTPGKTVIRRPLRVQLILSVETASHDDAAVLTVDTLDVEARRA